MRTWLLRVVCQFNKERWVQVVVVQTFWARIVNRSRIPHLLRTLPRQVQLILGHKLGWKNIMSLDSPDAAYELDLRRPDDVEVGARLFRAAVDHRGRCINNLLIDGVSFLLAFTLAAPYKQLKCWFGHHDGVIVVTCRARGWHVPRAWACLEDQSLHASKNCTITFSFKVHRYRQAAHHQGRKLLAIWGGGRESAEVRVLHNHIRLLDHPPPCSL